jgi:hypothetical protein
MGKLQSSSVACQVHFSESSLDRGRLDDSSDRPKLLPDLRHHGMGLGHVAFGVDLGHVGLGMTEDDLGGFESEFCPDQCGGGMSELE